MHDMTIQGNRQSLHRRTVIRNTESLRLVGMIRIGVIARVLVMTRELSGPAALGDVNVAGQLVFGSVH